MFKGTAGEKLRKEVVKKSKAIIEEEQTTKNKSSRSTQEQEKIKVVNFNYFFQTFNLEANYWCKNIEWSWKSSKYASKWTNSWCNDQK